MADYVEYRRVSTVRQGQSGLGLEAQQAAVESFVRGRGTIVATYIEVESGKKDRRPQLLAAIADAKQRGATLLIAKLDRLSRNAGFIFALRDSGVDFVCCDMPDANTLTVGIFAVLAQHERETTSKRTVDALAAKKARGHKLGTPANLTPAARAKGAQVRQENARNHKGNRQATELASLYRSLGWSTRQIAEQLNKSGYTTRRGKAFYSATVSRLLRGNDEPKPNPDTL